ncbi:MAG: glycosyl hydrolase [Clostridia bacterium]|nr:glycosyl hydrolase [Clostridia bacterium]
MKYTVNGSPKVVLSVNEDFMKPADDMARVYKRSEFDPHKGNVIVVDPNKTFQTVDGFGASFTDTAAVVMSAMPKDELDRAMTSLFDKEEGIGINMIRNCIAGSDFAPEYYTYDDMPEGEEDWELEHFDFSHDLKQIVPLTKRAFEMAGDCSLILSPWSPPLWMKDQWIWQAKTNPELREECYEVYAKYLVKSIQAYEEAGLPVNILTVQNEPYALVPWPGMHWDREVLIDFTNKYMRPALNEAGLKTKILNLDHNFNFHYEANSIMENTMESSDGIAYHWYHGQPEQMLSSYDLFPDKLIYVTEASSSTNPCTIQRMANIASKIARSFRSGAGAYVLWNMALDHNGGPTYNNVNVHCSGLLVCNTETGKVSFNMDYYSLGHFSKYVKKGAKRIHSTDTADAEFRLVNAAFLNPDGSVTTVIVNRNAEEEAFCKVLCGDSVIELTLPAASVATLQWKAEI